MKEATDIYRLAVVGPESSGKSSAVEAVALELRGHGLRVGVVTEAGRAFASGLPLDHVWTMADELAVGRLHLRLMAEAASEADVVVSDGAVITPRVWSLRAFGAELPELAAIDDTDHFDLVALAAPDLPWVADPLRTVPANRAIDFQLYQELLAKSSAPVVHLSGTGHNRLTPLHAALNEELANRRRKVHESKVLKA